MRIAQSCAASTTGQQTLRRVLVRLSLPEHKSIGSMTERQRIAVAALLTANTANRPRNRSPARQHSP